MYRVHLVKIPGRSTGTWEQKELKKKLFSIFSTSIIFFVYPNIFLLLFRYNVERKWLVQGGNARCLDMDPAIRELFVAKCDKTSLSQQWNIQHIDMDQLAKWDDPTKDLV